MKVNEILVESDQLTEKGLLGSAFSNLLKFGTKSTATGSKAGKAAKAFKSKGTQQQLSNTASSNITAKQAAKSTIAGLGSLGKILGATIGVALLNDIHTQYQDLEDQYNRFNSGDTNTAIFSGISPDNKEEAKSRYEYRKNFIIGEALITVAPLLKRADVAWNIMKWIAGKAGWLGGAALGSAGGPVGAMIGGSVGSTVSKIPFSIGAKISKLLSTGPGSVLFLGFLATEGGQEFLNSAMSKMIIASLGNVTDTVWEFSSSIMSKLAKSLTGDDKGSAAQGTTPSTDTSGKSAKPSDKSATKATEVQLPPDKAAIEKMYTSPRIRFDRKNPNIMYIDDYQITDDQGYQYIGDRMMNYYKGYFKGKQDPTASIPKKPGRNYNQ